MSCGSVMEDLIEACAKCVFVALWVFLIALMRSSVFGSALSLCVFASAWMS